jgi:hypothetical protein
MRTLLFSFVVLFGASEGVLAQAASPPGAADPRTGAPRPSYRSAFSDYQPFRDEEVRPWKEVNKEVADNPGMGSMKHGSGSAVPGPDASKNDRKDDHKGKHHEKKH